MPCYCPLTGYYSKEVSAKGKRGITFTRGASFSGVPIRIPCGQCTGCRLERSRQWAMRCIHESKLFSDNVFVTLTYDNKSLPEGGTLVKRDLQLFMKRLRKKKGAGVRFYGCGEYGETTYRPHYHAILFNCDFYDKVFYKESPSGERMYTSQSLSDIWPHGFNVIGSVTFDSAAYVARYIMKKVTGDAAAAHYERYDIATGEIFNLQPEFTNMSRGGKSGGGGIGKGWFDRYGSHAYELDSVVFKGQEVRPPRYYDSLYEVVDSDRLSVLKLVRRRKAALGRSDNTPERRRVREAVSIARLALKGRVL